MSDLPQHLRWVTPGPSDVRTALRQAAEEGRDTTRYEEPANRLSGAEAVDPDVAWELMDALEAAPSRSDYAFEEPNDLGEIRSASSGTRQVDVDLAEDALRDRILGAWTGRCAGCLLGKPVERWTRDRIRRYAESSGQWPLESYLRWSDAAPVDAPTAGAFIDRVSCMPEDDDLDWTVIALLALERARTTGEGPTSASIANLWIEELPLLHVHTAERVAYRNLANGLAPPRTATWRNPYREWIGATIRADLYGWVCPGDPSRAAELAWRDARISHVKNGIYSAMWVAATTALAFAASDLPAAVRGGMTQIPTASRLHERLTFVVQRYESGAAWEDVIADVHRRFDENDHHGWCHAVSNAEILGAALLWGEGDFTKTVALAVSPGFDTDSNGATAGAILGLRHGAAALPARWTEPLAGRVETGLASVGAVELAALTDRTMALVDFFRHRS